MKIWNYVNIIPSTYKWNCRGLSKNELDEYEAEYKLVRELDRNIDEQAHDPIERCAGFAVTGNLNDEFKTNVNNFVITNYNW